MEDGVARTIDGSRARGALLGLAVGDALGTTLEFAPRGTFTPIVDMWGGGPFDLPAGAWTDDTSMALCLAESLVQCGGFDPVDQLRRYLRWWREGHLSSTGRCFDIGLTVRGALSRFVATGEPWCGSLDPQTAGNGSIMRLAPVPIAFADDPPRAMALAADSSRTTHAATEAVDACRYLAALLVGALQGRPRMELLAPRFTPVPGAWEVMPLAPAIDAVAAGSFATKAARDICASGYVVQSLEAALWAFASTDTFEAGALAAVNLGCDADTTGAVYGQLAGAHYGEEGIPRHWRERLLWADRITALADSLLALPSRS